jgi:hypothetical protein
MSCTKFGKSTSFPCVSKSSSTNSLSHRDDLSQREHDPLHHLGPDPHTCTRLHPTMTSDTMHDHLRETYMNPIMTVTSNTLGRPQEHITREFPSTLTSQIKIYIVVYYTPLGHPRSRNSPMNIFILI